MVNNLQLLIITTIFMCSIGCTKIHKDNKLEAIANLRAEGHEMWTRPTEVGFNVGKTIRASATTSKIFMLIPSAGDPIEQKISLPMFGGGGLSPVAKFAAARAVEEAKADGIYVLKVETTKKIVFPIWTTEATITGKALQFKSIGTVNEGRADTDRFGKDGCCKGGGGGGAGLGGLL
jgi:hypothetical protein